MAEPSNIAYNVPENYYSNNSRYDTWNNFSNQNYVLTSATGSDQGQSQVQSQSQNQNQNQEIQSHRDNNAAYQYSVMTPVDHRFDASGSDWSSTENTRPISTPNFVDQQPPPPPPPTAINLFGGGATNFGFPNNIGQGGRFLYSAIEAANAPNFYPYSSGNFDQQQIYMNAIATGNGGGGGGGGYEPCRYATTTAVATTNTAAPLDLSSQSHYQETSTTPYFQQATFPINYPNYPNTMPMFQNSTLPIRGYYHDGNYYYYRSALDNSTPRLELSSNQVGFARDNISLTSSTTATSLNQLATPIRSSIAQIVSLRNPSFPMPASTSGTVGGSAKSKTIPKLKSEASIGCYTCGRRYVNERAFHSHWLRVHVLQSATTTTTSESTKRKHVQLYSSPPIDNFQPLLPKKSRIDGGAFGSGTIVGEKKNVGENYCEKEGEHSAAALVDANLPTNESTESTTVLDLSVKAGDNGKISNENTGSTGQMLQFGDRQQQSPPPPQQEYLNSISMGGRIVETRSKMTADCVTIRSADLALAFILPSGILPPGQAKTTTSTTTSSLPQGVAAAAADSSKLLPPGQTSGAVGAIAKPSAKSISNFRCAYCPKVYRSRRSLQKHTVAHHNSDPSHTPKKPTMSVFEDVAAMEQLPYACSLCPKRFTSERLLKQHLAFHRRADAP